MEFDKSRCYSALDADELHEGDKVIVANSLSYLRHCVECDDCMDEIVSILSDDNQNRFLISGSRSFALVYLVERKENCLKCKKCEVISDKSMHCDWVGTGPITSAKVEKCNHYEPNAEKHYRPFANTDELIKTWDEKIGQWHDNLEMPYIWVRYKINQCGQMGILITKFEKNYVQIEGDMIAMHALMADYEFLDGSVCGVEE